MSHEAVSVDVDEAQRLIRVAVIGPLTESVLFEWTRVLKAIPQFQEGYAAFVDLSGITTTEVSSEAVVAFAQAAHQDNNRVAIFAPNIAAFGIARLYEIIADPTESRVRVFTDEGLAFEWLTR